MVCGSNNENKEDEPGNKISLVDGEVDVYHAGLFVFVYFCVFDLDFCFVFLVCVFLL